MTDADENRDWLLNVMGCYGRTSLRNFAFLSASLVISLSTIAVLLWKENDCGSELAPFEQEGGYIIVNLLAYLWLAAVATRRANDAQKTSGKLQSIFLWIKKRTRNQITIIDALIVGILFAMGTCFLVPSYVSEVLQMIHCAEIFPQSTTIYLLSFLGGSGAIFFTIVLPLRVLSRPSILNHSQNGSNPNEVPS